ncbi:MAG: HAD family hydrolase [Candidatus Woesearchaeota archaeon]
MAKITKAVFLDRDGTINVDYGFTYELMKFRFEEGVIQGLQKLKLKKYLLIITTGQSGMGRGYYTKEEYNKFTDLMLEELKKHDIQLEGVYYCPHHPMEGKGEFKIDCGCRKPKTGMIQKAVKDMADKGIDIDVKNSFVIGDKTDDIKMGENAGCRTILLLTESGKKGKDGHYEVKPTFIAKNLDKAADWIIKND